MDREPNPHRKSRVFKSQNRQLNAERKPRKTKVWRIGNRIAGLGLEVECTPHGTLDVMHVSVWC